MAKIAGRRMPLSLPRRWIADLMHASRGMPVFIAERRMNLAEVVAARRPIADPPTWPAVFAKGYSLVAAQMPELRRSYQPFPWTHLFEAEVSVASVAVAREFEGEAAVFFGLLHAADRQTLAQLTAHLHDFKTKPVADVKHFARLVKSTRYPKPVRRVIWWAGMNLTGRHRAKTFGTFGMTTISSRNAALLAVPSPCATTLTYGSIAEDGSVEVRLCCDHRVLDGLTAALALEALEAALNGAIALELRSSAPHP